MKRELGFTARHRGGQGSPMVCLHGFTDTWRTWELALPALEREHEVLAPTLPGHAGGPPLASDSVEEGILDWLEETMDEAGFETAHLVGNSLGGYLALKLAARGRARSVVALAPAGGWAEGDGSFRDVLAHFTQLQELATNAAPHADELVATSNGRRAATRLITTNYEHIPESLVAHMIRSVAATNVVGELIEHAIEHGWSIDPERIDCPVRIVWGTADRVLAWPSAAARFHDSWFPRADYVELEGIGHVPQLDVPRETAQLILDFTRE